MTDANHTTDFFPCPEGRERCAVDGVECECEQREEEKIRSETTLSDLALKPRLRYIFELCVRPHNSTS